VRGVLVEGAGGRVGLEVGDQFLGRREGHLAERFPGVDVPGTDAGVPELRAVELAVGHPFQLVPDGRERLGVVHRVDSRRHAT
jgi:hypothetical protein